MCTNRATCLSVTGCFSVLALLTNIALCSDLLQNMLCLFQARTWISNVICPGLFCVQWLIVRDDCFLYRWDCWPVFRLTDFVCLLTDFVCLLTYEFCLSLWKIARCSVILLLPLSLFKLFMIITILSICNMIWLKNVRHKCYYFFKCKGKHTMYNFKKMVRYKKDWYKLTDMMRSNIIVVWCFW